MSSLQQVIEKTSRKVVGQLVLNLCCYSRLVLISQSPTHSHTRGLGRDGEAWLWISRPVDSDDTGTILQPLRNAGQHVQDCVRAGLKTRPCAASGLPTAVRCSGIAWPDCVSVATARHAARGRMPAEAGNSLAPPASSSLSPDDAHGTQHSRCRCDGCWCPRRHSAFPGPSCKTAHAALMAFHVTCGGVTLNKAGTTSGMRGVALEDRVKQKAKLRSPLPTNAELYPVVSLRGHHTTQACSPVAVAATIGPKI
ncbi:hypothetical protein MRX96_038798 [Rhipicephalus microplus]